jgi:hypothetical protein
MSTIIIGGGGGHSAIDKLVGISPDMTAEQRAAAEALIAKFVHDVEMLVAAVGHGKRP